MESDIGINYQLKGKACMINKKICPVCGENTLKITYKKIFGITIKCTIRCNYCCHHALGKTKGRAYKNLWKNALNEEELKGDTLYV